MAKAVLLTENAHSTGKVTMIIHFPPQDVLRKHVFLSVKEFSLNLKWTALTSTSLKPCTLSMIAAKSNELVASVPTWLILQHLISSQHPYHVLCIEFSR